MKRIVILGGGESGVGAAVLAQKMGFDVFLSDMSKIKEHYKQMLDEYHIAWEDGQHTEALILNADEVIKSPGIPGDAPMMLKIQERGIPVISEIEFAGRYTDAKMVCITGSNGKTTTTSLIYHIFKSAGYNVGLAGNIGQSLAYQVATCDYDWYIIELSSFQLDNMYEFRANIAILLNITPDHLDRYNHNMQEYVDAKFRIVQNQTDDDAFIFWNDDPIIQRELSKHGIHARLYPFAEDKREGVTAYTDADELYFTAPYAFNMEQEELALTGKHNLYNSMAAGISAGISGIRKEVIREALATFKGVEHRLEYVTRVRGVDYINDSKATNVDAAWDALECQTRPVVWIVGGTDKGNDYTSLIPLAKEKVKAMICMGLDNAKFHDSFEGVVPEIHDVTSAKDAVKLAHEIAVSGDVVLLSPCCASFDLFKNYEDRGRQFKEAVRNL